MAERIDTARLSLRAPCAENGPALHAAVHASLPELRAWMIWAASPLDELGYIDHLRDAAERFQARTELRYLIFDRTTETLVGSTGIHNLNWRVPKGEIGYWVDTRFAGRGLVTEAVIALTEYAQKDLRFRRVEIRCDAQNVRSRAVAQRAGYTLDATLINDDVAAHDSSQLRDTLIFSRVQ